MTRRPSLTTAVSFLAPALAGLLGVGCATPSPIVRLTPRDADVIWAAGRAVVSRADTGVRVGVAFEHQAEDTLALRVEVANDTDGRLDVGPRDVTYTTCKSEAVASCAPAQWVIDPEAVLDTLEIQRSLSVANAKNTATAGTAMTILGVVGDVAAVGSGHAERAQNTVVASAEATAANDRSAAAIGGIEGAQVRWADAFRRNTLLPGQGVGGPVYIPIVPDAQLVWLQVKVAERRFTFSFSQETRRISVVAGGGVSIERSGPPAPR